MERVAMKAEIREKAGKGVARGLRRSGKVPAVLYSHGTSMPIAMGTKEISKILNTRGGEHALINLTLVGGKDTKEHMALIKDYQLDPISGGLIHVDLQEVAMNEKVKIAVMIHLTGTAAGAKEGGILQLALREVEVECLPAQIPEHFELNVSALKVNDSIHVRDIKAGDGVRILNDADATVVIVQPPMSVEKLESMLTAAPSAETGEPEVVGKKKEGEAEAAPAAGAKGKEAAPAKEAAKKEAAPKK